MLIRILVFALACTVIPAPHAQADIKPKVLVIADTGFDTSLPIFKDRIIQEVCILDWYSCPNGRNFQEGLGSATIPLRISRIGGFSHGTQMASIAALTNSKINLILIRIVAYTNNGVRLPVQEFNVARVLDWVIQNRENLNIGALAMAQGHHSLSLGTNYCPKNPIIEKKILELRRLGIPVVLPAGNAADKSRIDWPACIPAALAIGSSTEKEEIAKFSNMDRASVDFYTLGYFDALMPGGGATRASGTSVSTLIAAANWVARANEEPDSTFNEIFEYFRQGPIIFDEQFNYGRLMFTQSEK